MLISLIFLSCIVLTLNFAFAADADSCLKNGPQSQDNLSVSEVSAGEQVSVLDSSDNRNLSAGSPKVIEIVQDNYESYFNPRTGKILDDANIASGDILKIGNISGRAFVIDRPLTLMPISPADEISNGFIHLVKGSDGSTITNLTINNTKGTLSIMGVTVGQLHGIWLSNSNNNLIAYNTIRIANTGGVYAMPMGWSSNNRIIYNDMKTYVTSNIIMGECHYNLISHNRIEVLSYSDVSVTNLIYFNPFGHADYSGSPVCRGNVISYNYLKGFCTMPMSIILQCTYVNHDGTVIANNTIFKGSYGVNLRGENVSVYGNTVEGSAIGISVSGSDFCINDNNVSGSSMQSGISATADDGSSGAVFNNILNYTDVVSAMNIGDNVDASNNRITVSNYGIGISIFGNGSNVHNNNIKNRHDAGVSILGNFNTLNSNIINTKSVGVSIPAASTGKRYYNNTIINNRITSESYGVSIEGLVYNSVITDNVIETNATNGINLEITDRLSNTELDNMVNGIILNSTAIVVNDSNFHQYFDEYGYLTYQFPEGKTKIIILTFLTNKNIFFDDKINVISNKQNNLLYDVTITFNGDSEGSLISDFNFINNDRESIVIDHVNDITVSRNNITSIMKKGSVSNSVILIKDVCDDVAVSSNNIYVNSKVKYAYAIDASAINPSNAMMNKRLSKGLSVKDNVIIMISDDVAEAIYNDAIGQSEFLNNKINIISKGYGYGIAFANIMGRLSNITVAENEIVIHSKQMAYLVELHDVDNSVIANNTLYSDCNGSYSVGLYRSNNVSVEGNNISLFAGNLSKISSVSDVLGIGNSPISVISDSSNVTINGNLIYANAANPISLINVSDVGGIDLVVNSFVVDGDNFNVYFASDGLLKSDVIASNSNLLLYNITGGALMIIDKPLNISSFKNTSSVVSLVLCGNASNSTLDNLKLVNSTILLNGTSNVWISNSKIVSNYSNFLTVIGGYNNTLIGNDVLFNSTDAFGIILNSTRSNNIINNSIDAYGGSINIILDLNSTRTLIDSNAFNALGGDVVFVRSINSEYENVTNNGIFANASNPCALIASNLHHGFVGFNDILLNASNANASQSAITYSDSSSNNMVASNSIILSSKGINDYAVVVISSMDSSNEIIRNYLLSSNGLKRANSAVFAPNCHVDKNTPMDVYVSVEGDDLKGDGSFSNPYATIRGAVEKSLNHAIICVGDGYYNESDIVVDKDLTIVAINPGNVVIDANAGQLFNITKKGILTIDSLIIQNAHSKMGGSVFFNNGDLYICNSVICNSSAYHDNSNPVFDRDLVYNDGGLYRGHTQDCINTGMGGAILNRGNLVINSSLFYDNLGHWGGVIANYGKTSIDSSQFIDNKGVHGGVIYSNSKQDLVIENSLFNGNVAIASIDYCSLVIVTTVWSIDEGNRHEIRSECGNPVGIGGVVYTIDTSVELSNSTFTCNSARVGGVIATSADSFTSISSTDPQVDLIIDDCYFSNNRANDTRSSSGSIDLGDFSYNREHHGGVVYGTFNKLHITDSKFHSNVANDDGGALYAKSSDGKILDSEFISNIAGISGGALELSSNFVIMRTIISNNSARYGGAIEYTTPVYYGHIQDNLNIYNSTISHNRALNVGGAFNVGAGNITIRDSNIVDNLAPAYETIHSSSSSSLAIDMRYNYWGTSQNGYTGPDDSVWKVANNLFRPWYKQWVHWEPKTIEIDPVNPVEVDPEEPDNNHPSTPSATVNPTSTGSSTSTGTSIGGNGNGAGNGKYSGSGDGNNLGPGSGSGSGSSLSPLTGRDEYGGQSIIGTYNPDDSNGNSKVHGTVDSDSLSKSNSSQYNSDLQSVGTTSNAASVSAGASAESGESGSSSSDSSRAYEVTKNIDDNFNDNNLWIALIMIAIALIFLIIGFRRKQKENEDEY